MDALTLKGFLSIAGLAGLISGLGISDFLSFYGNLEFGEVLFIILGSLVIGLIVAGVCYLLQFAGEARTKHLTHEEMLPFERVILENNGCHFKTGRPFKFWEAVQGRLVLTTHRFVFLTYRGQPWNYKLSLPIGQIARIDSCKLYGLIVGGLSVITALGKEELFTFGTIHEDLEGERWAAGFQQACYRMNSENKDS
jgi:hypothetical protein